MSVENCLTDLEIMMKSMNEMMGKQNELMNSMMSKIHNINVTCDENKSSIDELTN